MNTVHLIFLLIALIFFALAGLGIPSHPRLGFLPWGLFFFALAVTNFRLA
jgi:hypothetical protein